MNDTKPWYQSRTVWLGAAQIAIGAGVAAGVIDETGAGEALGQAPEVIGGVLAAATGAAGVYYRMKADKKLSTKAEPPKE